MDLRKIKLDLTVALLNNATCSNAPKLAKDRLASYSEVGRFLGTSVLRKKAGGLNHNERRYSINFEHCTLDLQLITSPADAVYVVNGFELNRTNN